MGNSRQKMIDCPFIILVNPLLYYITNSLLNKFSLLLISSHISNTISLHNFIMNYNELTYHKASPFYKQGYLPDRAWYNRKPKQYPSEIPTGQEYFTDSGRKHYHNKFNHSEIEETGVLKSPQKYPCQNRIALEKTYMRNLDTTDIEGAGSGTRVNEAVRYKLRAQEELARKHHQSLDMREHKEHQYEEKRRQLAIKQYQNLKKKELMKTNESVDNSRVENNPEQYQMQNQNQINPHRNYQKQNNQPNQQYSQQYQTIGDRPYHEPRRHARHEDNKYINLLPKPYYKGLQQQPRQPQYVNKYIEPVQRQPSEYVPSNTPSSQSPELASSNSRLEENSSHIFNANDRHKSNPAYVNNYDNQLQRRREEYLKTIELDHATYNQLSDKKQFRKHNPTNLSFSLAGQSVVGGAGGRY